MNRLTKKIILFTFINVILLTVNILPFATMAAGYQLLEPSVIINDEGSQPTTYGLREYLETAYLILFVVIICAAVFYLVLGGLEYVLSDIPNIKLDGMSKFKKALLGLAIALLSYLILNIINPDLLNFRLDLINI